MSVTPNFCCDETKNRGAYTRMSQPTPVFFLGKPHGQRSLVGYSLWGSRRVGHDLATKSTWATTFLYPHPRSPQTLPVPAEGQTALSVFSSASLPPKGLPGFQAWLGALLGLTRPRVPCSGPRYAVIVLFLFFCQLSLPASYNVAKTFSNAVYSLLNPGI